LQIQLPIQLANVLKYKVKHKAMQNWKISDKALIIKAITEIDDYNKMIIAINWLIFCNYNKQKWQVLIVSFAYSN